MSNIFKKVINTVTKPFQAVGNWIGGGIGSLGSKIENAGTTGYRAPELGAPTYNTLPGSDPGMNYYGSPSSNFWANAVNNDFQAHAAINNFYADALRSEMGFIDPYRVDFNVNQPVNDYQAQMAYLDEANYAPAIQAALRQIQPGQGVAQEAITGMGSLADVLRNQMSGHGPSLAQLQLQQATDQNAAKTFGAIASQQGMNPGLGARSALMGMAGQNQAAAFQSSLLRNQEQMQAQEQLQNLYGQMGGLQVGQSQAASQALQAAGGLQNAQNQARVQNLAQKQALDAAVAQQNAQLDLATQMANQQTAFKNADMWQSAQNLNEQIAGRNLQAAMQAQGINFQVSEGNANRDMQAQGINANISEGNANRGMQAQQINANTALGNAQLAGQTNATNAGLYSNYLNAWNQNNATNAGLWSNWAGNNTQRYNINAGINQGNAQQKASNTSGLLGGLAQAGGAILGMFSDERIKHDIAYDGKSAAPGVPEALFRYNGDPSNQLYRGVLAQDLERVNPGMVGSVGGVKTVPPAFAPEPVEGMAFGGLVGSGGLSAGASNRGMGYAAPTARKFYMEPNANSAVYGSPSPGSTVPTPPSIAAAAQTISMAPQGNAYGANSVPPSPGGNAYGFYGHNAGPYGMVISSIGQSQNGGPYAMSPNEGGQPWGFDQVYGDTGSENHAYNFQGPSGLGAYAMLGGQGQAMQSPWARGMFPGMPGMMVPARQGFAGGGMVDPQMLMHLLPLLAGAGGGGGGQRGPQGIWSGVNQQLPQILGRFKREQPQSSGMPMPIPTMKPMIPGSGVMQAPQMPSPYAPSGYQPQFALPDFLGGNMAGGGQVPGTPKHPGQNVASNDTVPAELTPGEIVLPLTVTQADDAPQRAADFVQAVLAKKDQPSGYRAVLAKRAKR